MVNINELKATAIRKNYTLDLLAKEAKIEKSTFYRRIKNSEAFTIREVEAIAKVLKLTSRELLLIFFPSFVA